MKKNVLYPVILVLAFGLYSSAFAQMNYWTTPPFKFNMTLASPTSVSLPGYFDESYDVANGVFDQSGNLLFYIDDYWIYSATGVNVGKLGGYDLLSCDESYTLLQSEIAIIPIPGTCKQFYVIYAMDNPIGNCPLLYVKIDCSGASPTVTYSQMVNVWCPGDPAAHMEGEGFYIGGGSYDRTSFAVSKVVSGSGSTAKRYLYSTSFYGIYKYEITSTGISNELLTAPNATLGLSSSAFEGYEAEISWGNNMFAWVDPFGGKVHTINLDNNGNYASLSVKHYTMSGAKGIEFDNGTTTPYLFVSQPFGVSKINTSNQTVSAITLPSGVNLSNSFLEYGKNGKIYGVAPTYDAQGQLTATRLAGISSNGTVSLVNAGFDSRNFYTSIFTLPDQVDGDNYSYFFGNPLVTLSNFTLNGITPTYNCSSLTTFFNCSSISFNATYSGGMPTQYLLEIKATDNSCNPITGSGYINYISGWINGQPAANLDLRTLTDPNGLNLGNITGKVQVKYTIKDACGNTSTRTYPILISAAPPANIVLEIYNKNNSQVYLSPSHNPLSPVGVGTSSLGFRVNNSTGAITFYTVKIDEVTSSGTNPQEIYLVTKAINGAGGLTYEGLNSECIRDIIWPTPPTFGNCTNTNPAYNGYTGYFAKGDGQYSYLHYYKLTVTIGNPCNQSSDYSYLYVNSIGNKSGLTTGDVLSENELVENSLGVYPNPASDVVTFVINNSIDEHYSLIISDMYGRDIKHLMSTQLIPAGLQTRDFNIADLTPGMYTYRLVSPSFTRKGLLLKQ